MEHLTSPKLTPGVHCLSLRHKGMYVTAVQDPDEKHVLRQVRRHVVLVRRDADRLRPRRRPGQPDVVQRQPRLLQTLTTMNNVE